LFNLVAVTTATYASIIGNGSDFLQASRLSAAATPLNREP
jgi:hypothetical protein